MNIDQVLQASNRAKDLVRQILTFSRQTDQTISNMSGAELAAELLKIRPDFSLMPIHGLNFEAWPVSYV